MHSAEARVQTSGASRYLARLCQHAGKMRSHIGHRPGGHSDSGGPPEIRSAEWSDTSGYLVLSLGRCTLQATDGMLTIRAEASTPENLAQIQLLISRRLEGFGRRERLTVTWQPAQDLPGAADRLTVSDATATDAGHAPR